MCTEAFVPAAFAPHDGAPPPPSVGSPRLTMKYVSSGDWLALWDIAHVRRASDWKAPPLARETSGTDASSAYDDNAEFFAAKHLNTWCVLEVKYFPDCLPRLFFALSVY